MASDALRIVATCLLDAQPCEFTLHYEVSGPPTDDPVTRARDLINFWAVEFVDDVVGVLAENVQWRSIQARRINNTGGATAKFRLNNIVGLRPSRAEVPTIGPLIFFEAPSSLAPLWRRGVMYLPGAPKDDLLEGNFTEPLLTKLKTLAAKIVTKRITLGPAEGKFIVWSTREAKALYPFTGVCWGRIYNRKSRMYPFVT